MDTHPLDNPIWTALTTTQMHWAQASARDRYSKSEVKFVLTVSIAQLQKQVDQLAKQFRELDTRLQD
jgi:hypothetical protein